VIALLKTPTSQLAVNWGSQHPDNRKAGGHGPTLADEVEQLLPTPVTTDAEQSRRHTTKTGRSHTGTSLTDALLPTPVASMVNDGEQPETWLARQARHRARGINGNGMGMPLTIAVRLLPGSPTSPRSDDGSPPLDG
jgi:hypothetical protein